MNRRNLDNALAKSTFSTLEASLPSGWKAEVLTDEGLLARSAVGTLALWMGDHIKSCNSSDAIALIAMRDFWADQEAAKNAPPAVKEAKQIDLGKSVVTKDLVYVGSVCGGGAVGPGTVYKIRDYDQLDRLSWATDNRSGSKRSGSIRVKLTGDGLYRIEYVAISHSYSKTFFVIVEDGIAEVLTGVEFNRARKAEFPEGYKRHLAERRAEKKAA